MTFIFIIFLVLCFLYILLMLLSTYGFIILSTKDEKENIKDYPFISIIVPLRNEEANLPLLFDALKKQTYPLEKIEIIAIDDNSKDKSIEILSKYQKEKIFFNFKIVQLKNVNKAGKVSAIEEGIKSTSSEIILTTDADCQPPTTWVLSMVKEYIKKDVKLVCGPVIYSKKKGLLPNFYFLEFLSLVSFAIGMAGVKMPIYCNGANMLFNKTSYLKLKDKIKGKRFKSGFDVFFLHAIKKHLGKKNICYLLDKNALVATNIPGSFYEFILQRIRWASKAKAYRDFISIITSLVVFLFNLLIIIFFIVGFLTLSSTLLTYSFLGWIIKCLIDYRLLAEGSNFANYKNLHLYYLSSQIIYPFYVSMVGILSLFLINLKWKE